MKEIFWIFGFAVACWFVYQSYDAFRSVITGTHPKASGILSGVISGGIALILLWGLLLLALFGR
jgi:hypothetical protein